MKCQKVAIVRALHEGVGLSKSWFEKCLSNSIEVRYKSAVTALVQDQHGAV